MYGKNNKKKWLLKDLGAMFWSSLVSFLLISPCSQISAFNSIRAVLFITQSDDDQNYTKHRTQVAINRKNPSGWKRQMGIFTQWHAHTPAPYPVCPLSHQQKRMTTSFSWSWSLSPPLDEELLAREGERGSQTEMFVSQPFHRLCGTTLPIHPPTNPPPT